RARSAILRRIALRACVLWSQAQPRSARRTETRIQHQETQMNFFNEYALLVAVALPVVVIVGLQVILLVARERGTGLIPGLARYPSIETRGAIETAPHEVMSATPTVATA